MRFLDNMRIILGFVAMLMAVGWYGALYVGIDLPSEIIARAPFLAEAGSASEAASRSLENGSARNLPLLAENISEHAVPIILVVLAGAALFIGRRDAGSE